MKIFLYVNHSEKIKLGKDLTDELEFDGTLRNETSITNPSINLNILNPTNYNYAYIPDFNRYYFISDMVSWKYGLWKIDLHVDVLESFKNALYSVPVILDKSENLGANNYLPGSNWVNNVKTKTDIISFPNGLNETGEFILITAGG